MASSIINFNIGVLGHIDSGKTSLVKALSTVASTACFDKNPQSRERGITIDLGFSSFAVALPPHLAESKCETLQFTLVDCPGHASLIRTIIGGAQIIDLMVLVVDVTKGVQTQTAECLVIGEITCEKLLIVLNKVDLVTKDKQQTVIEKMTKRLHLTLEKTKFAGAPVIAVAAKPGGPEAPETEAVGIDKLVEALKQNAFIPKRDPSGPFILAVDHCFSIRGQGTVMTGTVLSGSISVGDAVEIPSLKETRKIKSIQMFKVPVQKIVQGDRAGVCLTQFEAKLMERGILCSPGVLPTIYAGIISISKIPYFKSSISSKSKFHVSVGHETVMAKILLFSGTSCDSFNFSVEYEYEESLENWETENKQKNEVIFALLEFEHPVTVPENSLVICSRLDSDIHLNTCRLAFQGKLLHAMKDKNYSETELQKLKVFKKKSKEGHVERASNQNEVIVKGLFKKESNIEAFIGLKVVLSTGEKGMIDGNFGQSGKIKVRIPEGLKDTTLNILPGNDKKSKKSKEKNEAQETAQPIIIYLNFKRYIYDTHKKMIQT